MSLVSSDIDSLFSAFSGASPGCAIGVVRDGEPILSIGYGMADLEHGVPFTPGSVSYLASVSKQFTALTTLLLVDDRKLALDECVKSIIPELPDCASDINIRHLLTHTSGLRPYGVLGYLSGLHSEHPYSEDDIIRFVSRHESLDFVPGKEFMYSNTGYVLLSIIVKRVTGQTLDEVAREKIFDPLGMKVSRFQHDHSALIANKAHGYERRAGTWHTSNCMLDVVGDGGMYSSVEDMLLWMKNFERPAVGARALKLMQTEAILVNGEGTGHGMGLGPVQWRGLPTVGHSGSLAGYRAMFRAFQRRRRSSSCATAARRTHRNWWRRWRRCFCPRGWSGRQTRRRRQENRRPSTQRPWAPPLRKRHPKSILWVTTKAGSCERHTASPGVRRV